MSGACSTFEESRGAYRDLVGKHEGKNHLGNPCVDGRIILRWIFRKWDGSMDWICLAKERDRWRALVNAVMNRGFHKMWGIS
jgi:hypothetical protein